MTDCPNIKVVVVGEIKMSLLGNAVLLLFYPPFSGLYGHDVVLGCAKSLPYGEKDSPRSGKP